MKTKVIFFWILILSLSYGQVEHTLPIVKVKIPYIGFFFNPGKSSLYNSEEIRKDTVVAFQREFSLSSLGGIFVGYRFSKKFLLELGGCMASYQQKLSGKDSLQEPFLINKKVNYAQVYILPKYQIKIKPDTTFLTIGIGYTNGMLLGASEIINNQPIDVSKGEISVNELYNKFIFGIIAEIGLEYWLSNSISFSATINYRYYFNDIENKKIQWYDAESKAYENYYENYYKDSPTGIPIRQALGLNQFARKSPTLLRNLGLNLRIIYYFIKK